MLIRSLFSSLVHRYLNVQCNLSFKSFIKLVPQCPFQGGACLIEETPLPCGTSEFIKTPTYNSPPVFTKTLGDGYYHPRCSENLGSYGVNLGLVTNQGLEPTYKVEQLETTQCVVLPSVPQTPFSCPLLSNNTAKVSLETGLESVACFSLFSQQKGDLAWGLNPWMDPSASADQKPSLHVKSVPGPSVSLLSYLLCPVTCWGCQPRLTCFLSQ